MNARRGALPGGICVALALLGCAGCATPPKPLSAEARTAIYARADAQFASAILLKPVFALPTNTLAVQLAPLLMIEEGGALSLETLGQVPIVYGSERKVLVNGRARDQVSYAWQFGEHWRDAKGVTQWQGIRITLSQAGQPAIWEVFRDSSGAKLIFVSQNLEAAALCEFGPALPGRRFSVERAVAESPDVIVARVLDDGAVPMGPIVHLRADSGDVSTLICRCMPSQTKRLAGQFGYELRPADACPNDVRSDPTPNLPALMSRQSGGVPDAEPLTRILRLPLRF